MKVLFINTAVGKGATTSILVKLSQYFRRKGHNSSVWGLYKKDEKYNCVPTVKYFLENQPSLGQIPFLIKDVCNFFKEKQPDVVFCSLPLANIIGAIAGRLAGSKKVIAIHHDTFPNNKNLYFRSRLEILLGSFFAHRICVSRSVLKSYSRKIDTYRSNLKVIHNAVSIEVSSLEKKSARERFDLPKSSFLIITVGRLAKQKNHDFLLRLIGKLSDCHLAICGEGELKNELKQKTNDLNIEKRVHFIGYIEPDEVPHFLRSGDLFAFPSIHEGFGLAVVEAMKSGLPIIASNIPTLKEVVNSAGILLPLEQSKWVEKIQTLKGNQKLLDDYSKKSLEHSEKFSFEKMAEQYLAVARGEVV